MSDINSKIEAAKEEVSSLKSKIDQILKSKRNQTLSGATKSIEAVPALRSPPALKTRRILKGHFGKVTSLHWSGDSRLLVSAGQDGNLLIWNAVTNNKLQAIHLKSSYVMAVGMEQSSGNMVACGGLDNLCTVYPRNNPDKAVEMASHDGFLSCCRFRSEREILTSSGDSTCIRWDIATAKPVSRFAEHTADAMFLSIKDPNVFASCSVDLSTKIWDIRTPNKSVQTFKGFHTADINAVEFMPSDSNCFATCGQDNTVRVFDLRAYNELAAFGKTPSSLEAATTEAAMPTDGFTSLTFSKTGRLIFCGDTEGNVVCFDVLSATSTPVYSLPQAHERQVSCVGISPAGDALCTGSWDGLLKIWA